VKRHRGCRISGSVSASEIPPVGAAACGEAAGGHAEHAAHALGLAAADDVVHTAAVVRWGQC